MSAAIRFPLDDGDGFELRFQLVPLFADLGLIRSASTALRENESSDEEKL
jgi:hypothetical protein